MYQFTFQCNVNYIGLYQFTFLKKKRKLNTKELMLLNCGVGEGS